MGRERSTETMPELPPECSMTTHTVLNAQPNETQMPKRLLQCQCDTDSCRSTDENEFLNLSNLENHPNKDEIDG